MSVGLATILGLRRDFRECKEDVRRLEAALAALEAALGLAGEGGEEAER